MSTAQSSSSARRGPSLVGINTSSTVADLLTERSKNSPIPPPSPIFTAEGAESELGSPVMGQLSFDLARTAYLDEDEDDLRFRDAGASSSTAAPGSPGSFIDFGPNQSDYSPVPSIASVRVAQKAARVAPPSSSRLATAVTPTDEHSAYNWRTSPVASPSGTQPLSLGRKASQTLGGAHKVSPPTRAPPQVPSLVVEANANSGAGNDSLVESDSSWREGLDAIVDQLGSSQNSALRVDAGPEARFNSILGPKLKINSPAPWDAFDGPVQLEPVPAPAPAPARKSTDTTRSQSVHPLTKEQTGSASKSSGRSRTRSFSVLSNRRAGPSQDDVDERDEAFKGLGLGFSQSGSMKADSPTKSRAIKSAGLTISPPVLQSSSRLSANASTSSPTRSNSLNNKATSSASALGLPETNRASASGSSSAPAHITAFAAQELVPRSDPNAALALKLPPIPAQFGSSSGPTTPTGAPLASPTSPLELAADPLAALPTAANGGPGFKLISLDEARQRETDRIAAAAAHRKAMQPVEHIAPAAPGPSADVRASRTRESTTDSNSTRASTIAAAGQSSPHARPALKNKKSGFLKRMMGNDAHNREHVPAMPVKESFRALPDDFNLQHLHAANATLIPTLEPSGPGATSGKVTFGALPEIAQDGGRMKLPALKLRPMSMAFSAGLPMDFLADEAGSRGETESLAPSSTETVSSSVFDSSSSSGLRTPLTPAFSPSLGSPTQQAPPMSPAALAALATAEGYAALREQFARATSAWMKDRHELERTIKHLRADLDKANKDKEKAQKLAQANLVSLSSAMSAEDFAAWRDSTLTADNTLAAMLPVQPQVSVLERSRAVKPNATGGAMFSGARA